MLITPVAQTVSNSSTSTSGGATTPAVNTTGATKIIVNISSYAGGATPELEDSNNNSWTQLKTVSAGYPSLTETNAIYYCDSPTVSSSHTFTATGTNCYATVSAVAVVGAATGAGYALPGMSSAAGITSEMSSPGSFTPPCNGCLLVSGMTSGAGSIAPTINSGFTASSTPFASGKGTSGGIAYLIQTTAGAVNPFWTANAAGVIISFGYYWLPAGTYALLATPVTPVLFGSTGNTINLVGFGGTSWSDGTPGSPSFIVSGGTITSQTVSANNAATFTFGAPSQTGTITVTDPSTGATATFSVGATSTPGILATFNVANGITINQGSYVCDSGQTFNSYTGSTYNVYGAPCIGNACFSFANGDNAWAICSSESTFNQCSQIDIDYVNGVSGGSVAVAVNANSTNASFLQMNLATCEILLYLATLPNGYSSAIISVTPGSVPATGTLRLTLSRYGQVLTAYLQDVTTGTWLNSSGSFQSTICYAFAYAYRTTLTQGYPGFIAANISTGSFPCGITAFRSGGAVAMFTPEIGCSFTSDRLQVINMLSVQGGYHPLSHALQRSPHGVDVWTTIGSIKPDTPFQVAGLTASTTYDYQIITTDALGNTNTSATLSVTTRATESLVMVNLPSGPYTQWTNTDTSIPNDTNGNPLQLHNGSIVFSYRYQMYLGLGQLFSASDGNLAPCQVLLYGSYDLINWTQLSGGGYISGTNSLTGSTGPLWTQNINSTQYSVVNRCKLIEDPTDGTYYGFSSNIISSGANVYLYQVFNSATPWGTYSYQGVLRNTGESYLSDNSSFIDYDGSRWFVADGVGFGPVPAGWGSVGNLTTLNTQEGCTPFRKGRYVAIISNPESDYFAVQQSVTNVFGQIGVASAATSGNATLFPTASPPAPVNQYDTVTPNNPNNYGCQQFWITQTVSNPSQFIMWADIWGDGNSRAPAFYMALPISFDYADTPSVPYVSSFVPQASSSMVTATLSGPVNGAVNYPSSNFTVSLNSLYTGTITPSDNGAGGVFTPSSLSWNNTSNSQTFTYTPSQTGSISISISSSPSTSYSGSPIAFNSLTATVILNGPSSITIGQLATYTITILSPYTGVLTPTDSLNADINPNLFNLINSTNTYQFTYFTGLSGNRTLTLNSNPQTAVGGSPITITVLEGQAEGIILSNSAYPGSYDPIPLQVGVPSATFVVTPNGLYTGVVTFSDFDSVQLLLTDNGTFNPSSLVFSNSSVPQTFTYTANSPGKRVISIQANGLTSGVKIPVIAQ